MNFIDAQVLLTVTLDTLTQYGYVLEADGEDGGPASLYLRDHAGVDTVMYELVEIDRGRGWEWQRFTA